MHNINGTTNIDRRIPRAEHRFINEFCQRQQRFNDENFGKPDRWGDLKDNNIDFRRLPSPAVGTELEKFTHPRYHHEVYEELHYFIFDEELNKIVRVFCMWQIREYIAYNFDDWANKFFNGAYFKYLNDTCLYG
jgi:hypothetical protein